MTKEELLASASLRSYSSATALQGRMQSRRIKLAAAIVVQDVNLILQAVLPSNLKKVRTLSV